MPTMLNVNEAKANFSGMLSEVESQFVTFTILKYGHPIARVVPIEPVREIRPLRGYGKQISVEGDLFSDDSSLWEKALRRTTSPNKSSQPVRTVVARPVRTNQAIDSRGEVENAEHAETDFVGRGQW